MCNIPEKQSGRSWVTKRKVVSQGTIGSFSYPFPGHLDAAASWLGNAASADQEGMYAYL